MTKQNIMQSVEFLQDNPPEFITYEVKGFGYPPKDGKESDDVNDCVSVTIHFNQDTPREVINHIKSIVFKG